MRPARRARRRARIASINEREREDARPGGNRDVLLAVEDVGKGGGLPAAARLEPPEGPAVPAVDGREGPGVVSVEDEASRGGEHAAPGVPAADLRDLPRSLPGPDVEGAEDLLRRLVARP